ncbi:type II secretion system protein, partial [Vibrio parahaemolyticus]
MTLRHKQQGFAMLAGLLIVIGTLAIGGIYYSQYLTKQRIVRNSESFYNRVLYLKTQIHAYA